MLGIVALYLWHYVWLALIRLRRSLRSVSILVPRVTHDLAPFVPGMGPETLPCMGPELLCCIRPEPLPCMPADPTPDVSGRLVTIYDGDGIVLFGIVGEGGELSSIRAELSSGGDARIYVLVFPGQAVSRPHVADTLDRVIDFARAKNLRRIVLITASRSLRHEARMAGLQGPLRGELSAYVAEITPGPRTYIFADEMNIFARASRLADLVATMLPASLPRATGSGLSGILSKLRSMGGGPLEGTSAKNRPFGGRSAMGGSGAGGRIALEFAGRSSNPFKLTVPNAQDLMPESIAAAADTATEVLGRFSEFARAVRILSFDESSSGMKAGRLGGTASSSGGVAHLASWYVQADQTLAHSQSRYAPGTHSPATPPAIDAFSLPMATDLDRVVAHELWHLIGQAFESRNYRVSLEMDIELGRAIGAESLGHAMERHGRGSQPINPAAFERLRTQISDYATTNLAEAHAELFSSWWCNPESELPLIKRFGELIDQHFPAKPIP